MNATCANLTALLTLCILVFEFLDVHWFSLVLPPPRRIDYAISWVGPSIIMMTVCVCMQPHAIHCAWQVHIVIPSQLLS